MTDNEDEGEEVQEGQASSHSQAMDDDDNAVDELVAKGPSAITAAAWRWQDRESMHMIVITSCSVGGSNAHVITYRSTRRSRMCAMEIRGSGRVLRNWR